MSARKRVRAFLKASSIHTDPPDDELLARRWADNTTTYDLRVSDLSELLRSERGARRTTAHLQRKNATLLQRCKDWDALSPVTLSAWKNLQNAVGVQSQKAAEATEKYLAAQTEANIRGQRMDMLRTQNITLRNTVAELSRKIQDPPGSHERWQELRQKNTSLAAQRDSLQTSLAQAEGQLRTQAETIEQLNAAKVRAEKAEREHLHKAARDALRGTSDPSATEIRRLRAELAEVRKQAPEGTVSYLREENRRLLTELADLHKQIRTQRDAANQKIQEYANQLLALPTPEQYAEMQEQLRQADTDTLEMLRVLARSKELEKERDRLQEALSNLRESVWKGTPPGTGGLNAEDLRKVAEDLLPQFLERFLPKVKL